MEHNQLLHKVNSLRNQGKSIRAIATELNVNRGRVDRALRALGRAPSGRLPAQSGFARSSVGLTEGAFVGRNRELELMKRALEGALSSQGQMVLLAGESGIGKTRTAEELASIARRSGVQVLWGRCPEEPGAPTYWPWVQAIRSCVLEQDQYALRNMIGVGAGDIAQIIPDIQDRLPGLIPPPPAEEPEQSRFRLFHSITSFLKRASEDKPILLVLESLHWADASSLRLLEFVAMELADIAMLLLGTYRDVDVSRGHPLLSTIGELTRQHRYQRVILKGLDRGEVGQVMEVVGGVALPQELVAKVHQQTEGNPLYVREVMRLLAEEGLLAPERLTALREWNFRLPNGIREVIGRRLDRLSGHCNQVLTVASAIGREFSGGLLAQVVEQPQDQLMDALEEALRARIIEELPSLVGHYTFSHSLIQQTLAAGLSSIRKIHLHACIAQALEDHYGSDAESHAAELAYHLAESEPTTGPEKLVPNIDDLPMPAWDLYNPADYTRLSRILFRSPPVTILEFSRGCVFKCDFCASKLTMGLGYRKK